MTSNSEKDDAADSIREKAVAKVYGAAAHEAAADGRLTAEEAEYLRRLAIDLELPASIAERINWEAGELHLHRYFDSAIEDERLAPDEERELQARSSSLGVPLALDERSQVMYERMKLYWLIENGEVPTLQRTPLPLQPGEKCYAEEAVEWYENRNVSGSVRYGGVNDRVETAKAIYFRAAEAEARRIQEDAVEHIDSGNAVLTSNRLVIVGGRKKATIQLAQILDFTPYSNGIDIQTDTGKPPFLKFGRNVDLFALMLDRAIRDATAT